MKILVIGSAASGKTTIKNYLRGNTNQKTGEVDEEILKLNNNTWPSDDKFKDNVLVPKIYQTISKEEDIIFFINYIDTDQLVDVFKSHGFRVVLLSVPKEVLLKRNKQRIASEGYEDARSWIDGQIENHKKLVSLKLVDHFIDAQQSTDQIVAELLSV